MNLKLFIVMGASWLAEIISTLTPAFEELFYVSDAFNVLQGVMVFMIFVCKKKVWIAMRARLGMRNNLKKLFTFLKKNFDFFLGFKPKPKRSQTTNTGLSGNTSTNGSGDLNTKYGKLNLKAH